jgi:hypothetical protein
MTRLDKLIKQARASAKSVDDFADALKKNGAWEEWFLHNRCTELYVGRKIHSLLDLDDDERYDLECQAKHPWEDLVLYLWNGCDLS